MAATSGQPADLYRIAYFSMEAGLEPAMPTYSGGLGVLAGDTLRAAADLAIPMVGLTLLHRKGYFSQHLDDRGNQSESPCEWNPEELLEPLEPRVSVTIEGREVHVRAWRRLIIGVSGHTVPVYFLDTALPENTPWDRTLTDCLYGGDEHYRLCQEVVLGLGGVTLLRALGHRNVSAYHMNEGHSALLALALLEERTEGGNLDIDAVRQQCVFTTHTPVPAGHDRFPFDLVRRVLGEEKTSFLRSAQCCLDTTLNMTYLALFFSHYVNGVSHRHEEISQDMFPNYPINSITNGVHAFTWTSSPFRRLYDRHIEQWRCDNLYLRYAISIPLDEIIEAHSGAKRELLAEVERRTDVRLDAGAMTLGFARRATAYKRAGFLFSDVSRLREIARQVGHLQVIYGGKAHPRDETGKAMIRRIFETVAALGDAVRVVYLEEYDMALAKYVCAGVDLWLNTPQKPHEASGTSGMKAALNGVPSLSVLDGWWIEGHVEGVTGWSIGEGWEAESNPAAEIASLYDKLESVILPMFYQRPRVYAEVMRSAIALNGSYFNAQRMMFQYLKNAYIATDKM
ncbi:MAG: alpha-glucan family phosphorylase [Thermodesulfobacteriota bacterium]